MCGITCGSRLRGRQLLCSISPRETFSVNHILTLFTKMWYFLFLIKLVPLLIGLYGNIYWILPITPVKEAKRMDCRHSHSVLLQNQLHNRSEMQTDSLSHTNISVCLALFGKGISKCCIVKTSTWVYGKGMWMLHANTKAFAAMELREMRSQMVHLLMYKLTLCLSSLKGAKKFTNMLVFMLPTVSTPLNPRKRWYNSINDRNE